MIFALSKIFWTFANPANLFLFALIVGFAAHLAPWRRVRRFGRWVLGLTIASAIILAVLPIGAWLFGPLEDRFPAIVEPPARRHRPSGGRHRFAALGRSARRILGIVRGPDYGIRRVGSALPRCKTRFYRRFWIFTRPSA
jgi:hypothetical protein